MRERLWNNILNVKFKALYACECSRFAGKYNRRFAFCMALITTGSVATWTFWNRYNYAWAVIISVAQIAQVASLYIPFLKHESEFLAVSHELESLYLELEAFWHRLESGLIDADEAANTLTRLRAKELEIEKQHPEIRCPERKRWIRRTKQKMLETIALDFAQG